MADKFPMEINLKLLEPSLELLSFKGNDFVDSFYDHLFHLGPELSKVFRNTDLTLQKNELLNGLAHIFKSIQNEKVLVPYLEDLGVRHIAYEVDERHYPLVKEAFLDSLKYVHEDQWSKELHNEWSSILDVLTFHMCEGAKKALTKAG